MRARRVGSNGVIAQCALGSVTSLTNFYTPQTITIRFMQHLDAIRKGLNRELHAVLLDRSKGGTPLAIPTSMRAHAENGATKVALHGQNASSEGGKKRSSASKLDASDCTTGAKAGRIRRPLQWALRKASGGEPYKTSRRSIERAIARRAAGQSRDCGALRARLGGRHHRPAP